MTDLLFSPEDKRLLFDKVLSSEKHIYINRNTPEEKYEKDKTDYLRKEQPLHVLVTKNQYTDYWMAIKDPNDES